MYMPSKTETAARQLGHHLKNGFASTKETDCAAERTDLVHHCYHGSSCIDATNEYGLLDRFCYCDTAEESLTAGLMCQFKATSICMAAAADDMIEQVTDQFCVNDGVCIAFVGVEDSHPGCICEGTWEGHHCEFTHGVLLDDALDLFQQRKAEIVDEMMMDGTIALGDEGEKEGIRFIVVAGSFVAVVAVINLFLFAARKSRKSRQQSNDKDYQSIDFGSVSSKATKSTYESRSLPPPADVFFASRKKEVESDDGGSFLISHGHETEIRDYANTGNVEMLDAETSRILEAQFKSCEQVMRGEEGQLLRSFDEEPGHELDFAPSYERDDETTDQYYGLQSGRITINSGKNPLSKLQDETPSGGGMNVFVDVDETVVCESEESIGLDELEKDCFNGVTSLDGEYEDDSDEEHYYV